MGAWGELEERDRLMDWFIYEDPVMIELHRPTWSTTPAGGKLQVADTLLAPQAFHVYPFKRRLTLEYKFNPQSYGEEKVENITWILIFNRETADIDIDDFFDPAIDTEPSIENRLKSGRYEVTFISARLWDRGQAGILYRG
jgi:hypothetical protein